MIDQKADKIVVGTQFKMSKLGAVRCPELANQTGIVIAVSARTTGITVRFDRRPKTNLAAQRDYVTPIEGQDRRTGRISCAVRRMIVTRASAGADDSNDDKP